MTERIVVSAGPDTEIQMFVCFLVSVSMQNQKQPIQRRLLFNNVTCLSPVLMYLPLMNYIYVTQSWTCNQDINVLVGRNGTMGGVRQQTCKMSKPQHQQQTDAIRRPWTSAYAFQVSAAFNMIITSIQGTAYSPHSVIGAPLMASLIRKQGLIARLMKLPFDYRLAL